jgi:hypothetical protein
MAAFDIPAEFRDKFGGAVKFDVRQLYPQTAAVSGVRPGVSGAASGQTTFQWQDGTLWWVPALSYFVIRGHFLDGSGNALARPPTGQLGYADNWPSTLFQQVQFFIDSQSLELLQNPPQSDTALAYSTVDKTYLKSFASASGLGEALQTRVLNSGQFGTSAVGATNYNEVVATWRPSLSIFDCAKGLPPGSQFRVDFSWSSTAEQNMIESIASKIAGTDYTFTIDEFTFYKATIAPAITTPLPSHGLIELQPVQVNLYPLTGGTTLQVQVPLPATANRMLICIQDNNSANNLGAGQNGLKPITDFNVGFSSGASDQAAFIQNLYVNFPELGYQYPNPTYTFTAPNAAAAKSGFERAYQDWILNTKGASGGYEGSVPFGSADQGVGTQIVAPLLTGGGPVVQAGNPDNDQQFLIFTAGTGATTYTATSAARTAMYGWLGRKAILCAPIVRPEGTVVSTAQLYLQMSASVTSVNVYVIMSYDLALAIEKGGDGKYHYQIVRGV